MEVAVEASMEVAAVARWAEVGSVVVPSEVDIAAAR
jgi:hypothetical protein